MEEAANHPGMLSASDLWRPRPDKSDAQDAGKTLKHAERRFVAIGMSYARRDRGLFIYVIPSLMVFWRIGIEQSIFAPPH